MRSYKMAAAGLALALMMLGAGTASATTLTSPAGTQYSGTIKLELAENEAVFKSTFIGEIKCKESVVEGEVSSQGAAITARISLSTFDFSNCNAPFTALKPGVFEVHTDSTSADGNGILTSSGTEITFEIAGFHCIISTSNTELGTVTGGAQAELAIPGVALPRTGGRSGAFCGKSLALTARYKIVTPSTLLVD
jgi:hypothetical protein